MSDSTPKPTTQPVDWSYRFYVLAIAGFFLGLFGTVVGALVTSADGSYNEQALVWAAGPGLTMGLVSGSCMLIAILREAWQ